MQTDARVFLNLAAEERQQLCCSQGSPVISRGKKIFSANSQLNLSGSGARRACSSRIYSACNVSACVPRLKASLLRFRIDIGFARRFAFPSVWPLLYFANLASPSQPLSAFQFSLTPSPPLSPPHFLRPAGFYPSFHREYRATLFRIGKKRMENRVGCPMKERWREMKFEEASI